MERHTRCRIEGNHIIPPTGLELIISDHCNISCRQCNHGSPYMRNWNADPLDVARDLGILARVFRPAFLKMIGGEPLLHPDLPGVIRAACNSGITDHYTLVTNGILLDRAPEDLWKLIDEIEISRYAAGGLDDGILNRARRHADKHGVKFTLNVYHDFRLTFTKCRIDDDALVQKIFRACKMANVWGCFGLYKGRIYRCPQSMYAPALAGIEATEGIAVSDSGDFQDRLFTFLTSPEPLVSCRYCVGTSGRKQPHRLLTRKEWHGDLAMPVEAMIDRDLLERNLTEINPLDDCKLPVGSKSKQGFTVLLRWSEMRRAANRMWHNVW